MVEHQLAFDLRLRPKRCWDAEDFFISESNREAVRWLEESDHWPAPGLVLHGPSGCGKTHLSRWYRAFTKGVLVEASDLPFADYHALSANVVSCVIEDADRLIGGVAEQSLLHLYNALAISGGRVLLTARTAPRDWATKLPDLRSRLQALPTTTIHQPDDALAGAILIKLFRDRQLKVDGDVVGYLLPRLERSFSALHSVVVRLDQAGLREQRRLTIPFVRGVIGDARGDRSHIERR
ncbi:MAG: DNA replication protein [Rhodospirillales bacterium]|nr:DNA replication protein [Rhodospirillales bacterium]